MDVFSLRDRVIQDYADYVRSFVQVRDRRIDEFVQKSLRDEVLWPQPLIQLNPSFEPGGWVDDLVDRGLLHAGCRKIFRIKTEEDPIGSRMLLHRHQVEAIEAGRRGQNYVLTTGTGSGKSLTYLIPIVDRVLRNGGKQDIQAVVVYPMNALCNSQYGELEKFLRVGFGLGKEPVRFDRYTGQECREQRDRIIQNPPDILLTNYVMLELLLTRPFERPLVNAARDLRFLVLETGEAARAATLIHVIFRMTYVSPSIRSCFKTRGVSLMPATSQKLKEAEETLPEELKPVFRRFVDEYEYLTSVHYGRGYVPYKVLADLVLAGWRPSAERVPGSKL